MMKAFETEAGEKTILVHTMIQNDGSKLQIDLHISVFKFETEVGE